MLEWHLVCLVPAMTSSGTTVSLPGSSEQLQQATTEGRTTPSSSGSCFLLCLSPCVWVFVCVCILACFYPHSLSALCKGKVIYSLTFPVLMRTPGLRVKSCLSCEEMLLDQLFLGRIGPKLKLMSGISDYQNSWLTFCGLRNLLID